MWLYILLAALGLGGLLWWRGGGLWRKVGEIAFIVAVAYLALEGWKAVMGRRGG